MPSPTLPINTCVLRILHVPAGQLHCSRETVEMLSRETRDFIWPMQWHPNSPDLNPVDYDIGRLQEHVYRSIRDVNHLMERLIEEWCDLDHNIICAAVQWISGVLVCEPACVLMEGTLNISCNSNSNSNRYLSFELIPTVFIVLETCVFSVSSKR